jgi:hypothetical protein
MRSNVSIVEVTARKKSEELKFTTISLVLPHFI